MPENYDGIRVLSYSEWMALPANRDALLDQICLDCLGEKYHQCECGDYHECRSCDGLGVVSTARDQYEKALKDEINALHAWIEGKGLKIVHQAEEEGDNYKDHPSVIIHIIPPDSKAKGAQ